ncbi:hypothetical protein H0H81_010297, partial [Sphagnurus paluster]
SGKRLKPASEGQKPHQAGLIPAWEKAAPPQPGLKPAKLSSETMTDGVEPTDEPAFTFGGLPSDDENDEREAATKGIRYR